MTKQQRAAMRLVLEALEFFRGTAICDADTKVADEGITALCAAMAEPEPEPVAWMFQHDETGRMNYVSNDGVNSPERFIATNPRYALVCALYTSPPTRRPLTGEEIEDIWNQYCDELGEASINDAIDIGRAIERAHGITGGNDE